MEVRCVVCWEQWDLNVDPVACICDDGGLWQLRIDGDAWGRPVNREGQPDELPR